MRILENLEPNKVFYYFEELTKIPHGSRNTRQISNYLAAFAKEHHLEYYQDESNNVVMIQEASAGYEDAEPIIIQGHMDMVCEKEEDCPIDFEKDALDLYIDGDFVRARGTTLGGDDGVAIAYALAILDSPELKHPRLEVVITVDEEIGMLGAEVIDLSMLKGHRMLNIDSDVENQFLTSCAGGMSVVADIPGKRVSMRGRCISLKIDGLQGGHSGGEIDKERANANILMGRLLRELSSVTPFGIISLQGGKKDNAIPRSCAATIMIPWENVDLIPDEQILVMSEDDLDNQPVYANYRGVLDICRDLEWDLKKELRTSDPDISLQISGGEVLETSIFDPVSTDKLTFFLRTVPNGIQNMSLEIPGLVETSLNLGILELDAKSQSIHMVISVRSSVSTRMFDVCDKVCHLIEMMGGEAAIEGDYPAWEYKAESPLREQIAKVYQEVTGTAPVFDAIHAGLECGILSEKIVDLDCVSFGPTNYDIHTPKERLSISSTRKYWEFLIAFLEQAR